MLRSFGRARDGAALVEFALITPLLLMLYFGSVETSSLFTVDRRVTIIAGTVGDLVAQWNPSAGMIDNDVIDYFDAAEAIMTPYDPTGLQQVVSFVAVNSSGVTKVLWSKAAPGGGTPRAAGSSFPLDASTQMNEIARNGGFFIASETSFSYKPLLGMFFTNAFTLNHTSYFLPRFGACIQVTGSSCS